MRRAFQLLRERHAGLLQRQSMHDRGERGVRHELRSLLVGHHEMRHDGRAARVHVQNGGPNPLPHHDDARDLLVLRDRDGLRRERGAVQSAALQRPGTVRHGRRRLRVRNCRRLPSADREPELRNVRHVVHRHARILLLRGQRRRERDVCVSNGPSPARRRRDGLHGLQPLI